MPAVLLVDRPAILALFLESGALAAPDRLAVVCIDGTPASVVDWLKRAFAAGRRAPVLYVHDAATVIYPFTLEPLATLLSRKDAGSIAYTDLGLPPLGATADVKLRQLIDAFVHTILDELHGTALFLELEALSPATLIRYCTTRALTRGVR